ncbi:hypothetical protein BJD55_gp001 [Gordonia phage Yvonnetastic]|uniref:Uncharacterized protein n=1 Tax=Gordonia phage Yvonnetastic TaxID=1821566 RepID=A0A142K8W7_9CAUD|nr:hypothetical protein BJD55_gp001 [Gordonia phage Yvonnetastic]AMS02550.1 hypothetical protein SEA_YVONNETASTIC_1 [Gordonia phage Yvonnetastic]
MGMFDDVVYQAYCPWCGKNLTDWQSKDAGCCLDDLTPRDLYEQARIGKERWYGPIAGKIERGGVTFYTTCSGCGTSVDIIMGRPC